MSSFTKTHEPQRSSDDDYPFEQQYEYSQQYEEYQTDDEDQKPDDYQHNYQLSDSGDDSNDEKPAPGSNSSGNEQYPMENLGGQSSEDEDSYWDHNKDKEKEEQGPKDGDHGHHPHGSGLRKTCVVLPTGKRCALTVPIQNYKQCDKKTKLITLRPNGRIGKREYKIVSNELKKTKMSRAFKDYDVMKIQKIVNCDAWKRFRDAQRAIFREAGFVNERMLFHGSPAVDQIVRDGFDQRHTRCGKIGCGVYFAKESCTTNWTVFGPPHDNRCRQHHKKLCYVCTRKMLLCRVTLGKQAENVKHLPAGHHSLVGVPTKGGSIKRGEYALPAGDQAYPEYLITYKIKK